MHKKKIIIAPLNWGLGHATRCIPIINELKKYPNIQIIIASNGQALQFLKTEFPDLQHLNFKSINIRYQNKNKSLAWIMLLQLPILLFNTLYEYFLLQYWIKKYCVSAVISDNRYGCFSAKVPTVFITHQIFIQVPYVFLQKTVNCLNHWFIRRFNECWIPDFEPNALKNNTLSGNLAHASTPSKMVLRGVKFVGALSRFLPVVTEFKYFLNPVNIAIVLSGLEPQRSIFENIIMQQLNLLPPYFRIVVVRGVVEQTQKVEYNKGNVLVYNYLNSNELNELLLQTEIVIARSGYSTVMDLAVLGKPAIFVPTPQQTEQEYVAQWLHQKGMAIKFEQHSFNISEAVRVFKKTPFRVSNSEGGNFLLQKVVKNWLSNI